MSIDYELTFQGLGFVACIAAAGYLIVSGMKKAGALLLAGFVLILQASIYFVYFEPPKNMGACWFDKKSYYACLPLGYRLSIHAGQAGHFLVAAGMVVLAATSVRLRQKPSAES